MSKDNTCQPIEWNEERMDRERRERDERDRESWPIPRGPVAERGDIFGPGLNEPEGDVYA